VKCLSWYGTFPFETALVDARGGEPFTLRPARLDSRKSVYILDPADPQQERNLGERVDEVALQKLRSAAQEVCEHMKRSPGTFWQERRDRWRFLDERRYG